MLDSDSDDGRDGCFVPAVLQRPKIANHMVHESFTVDTRDHEDHTFCGVMFDICCRADGGVPLEFLQVSALSVRGDLGLMTVWTTRNTFRRREHAQDQWEKIYEMTHPPSPNEFVKLEFDNPIRMEPGETRGMYVHSQQLGDDALVYDNQRLAYTYEDDVFRVLPGIAHLSNKPFGKHGMWGFPWRESREFVGRFFYDVCYKLWNPEVHSIFPRDFQAIVRLILLCARRSSSPLNAMQDEVLYYILNMCKYDWFRVRRAAVPSAAGANRARGGCGYPGRSSWQPLHFSSLGGLFPNQPGMVPFSRRLWEVESASGSSGNGQNVGSRRSNVGSSSDGGRSSRSPSAERS